VSVLVGDGVDLLLWKLLEPIVGTEDAPMPVLSVCVSVVSVGLFLGAGAGVASVGLSLLSVCCRCAVFMLLYSFS